MKMLVLGQFQESRGSLSWHRGAQRTGEVVGLSRHLWWNSAQLAMASEVQICVQVRAFSCA